MYLQKKPTFAAVAVKYGWKASDSHEVAVSPENPIVDILLFKISDQN